MLDTGLPIAAPPRHRRIDQESEFTFEWHASIVSKRECLGRRPAPSTVVSLSPEVQFPGRLPVPVPRSQHRHPSSTNSIMQMRWFRQHENVGTPFKILPHPSQKPRFRFSPSVSWYSPTDNGERRADPLSPHPPPSSFLAAHPVSALLRDYLQCFDFSNDPRVKSERSMDRPGVCYLKKYPSNPAGIPLSGGPWMRRWTGRYRFQWRIENIWFCLQPRG